MKNKLEWNFSYLPSHVTSSGVIERDSSGLRLLFKPVSAGIRMVENPMDNPKSTINKFFTELAHIYFKKNNAQIVK